MTHHQRILEYLKTGKTLTVASALHELGTTSAQQRINELRRGEAPGIPPQPIKDKWERSKSGARYKVYYLDVPTELFPEVGISVQGSINVSVAGRG